MSDESDDKTEAPTPHRLEKAREEGQIPRSRELTSLLILLVGVSVIWFGGVSLARRLSGMLSAGLHFDHSIIKDESDPRADYSADQRSHAGAAATD